MTQNANPPPPSWHSTLGILPPLLFPPLAAYIDLSLNGEIHPNSNRRSTRMPITLSETAAKEIKSIIKDQGLSEAVALRVGVKGGGCSGFREEIGRAHV